MLRLLKSKTFTLLLSGGLPGFHLKTKYSNLFCLIIVAHAAMTTIKRPLDLAEEFVPSNDANDIYLKKGDLYVIRKPCVDRNFHKTGLRLSAYLNDPFQTTKDYRNAFRANMTYYAVFKKSDF